ncbi:MAG: hypothetical protein KA054_00225 [Candidatus Moranbacteria bacterium]|nr:hypothetical protein [Candidatus Moranbacteria bacterium]
MGIFDRISLGGNKGGKSESPLERQERVQQEEIARAERERKDKLWKRAHLDAQGRQEEPLHMSTSPLVSGKQVGSPAEDPYNTRERLRDDRMAMGLPVDEISVVHPNAVGEARIRRGTFEEEATSSQFGSILSPEMDSYIQNQMMEEEAAREAQGRDPNPVTEN